MLNFVSWMDFFLYIKAEAKIIKARILGSKEAAIVCITIILFDQDRQLNTQDTRRDKRVWRQ